MNTSTESLLVTPSLVPKEISTHKKFNIGDKIVLDQTLTQYFHNRLPYSEFSYWNSSSSSGRSHDLISSLAAKKDAPLIVAGTNCISENFSISKNICPNIIQKYLETRFTALLFVGLTGAGKFGDFSTEPYKDDSMQLLRTILDNGLIAARCRTTYNSLIEQLPKHRESIHLTGCISSAPIINTYKSFAFSAPRILFSFTDRAGSGASEMQDLARLITYFGPKNITVALNQERVSPDVMGYLKANSLNVANLTKADTFSYYAYLSGFDLHVGSRAHIHIPMLSMGIRSFLTGFESRQSYFQHHYSQPLIKCGNVGDLKLHDMIYTHDFSSTKKQLVKDSIQRQKCGLSLRKKFAETASSTTYNINPSDQSQWNLREDKAIKVLSSIGFRPSITELGPGNGSMMDKLQLAGLMYRGYDIIARRENITSLDCTRETVPPRGHDDLLLALGVMEYIPDLQSFFSKWLASYRYSLVSYNACTSERKLRDTQAVVCSQEIRKRNEWNNGLTIEQLRSALGLHGITIVAEGYTKYDECNRLYAEYMLLLRS